MTMEKLIIEALAMPEYWRKQIAMVLIASTLTHLAQDEAISIIKHEQRMNPETE